MAVPNGKKPKVYIAASSSEIERAKVWRDRLNEVGVEAMARWIESVEAAGFGNPEMWPSAVRRRAALDGLLDLTGAQLVWFLVPPDSLATRGAWAWVEVGFAYACAKPLVFSGQDTKQSIFCALGHEYDTDDEAFARIVASLEIPAGGEA